MNLSSIYEAVEKLETQIKAIIDASQGTFAGRIVSKRELRNQYIGEKTAEEYKDEAVKEFRASLIEIPRFKDFLPYDVTDALNYVRDIAKDVFLIKNEIVPFDAILRNLFLPGKSYKEGIWVCIRSEVDDNAILIPPVLIGNGCRVARDAVVGPFSCIVDHSIGEGACLIKTILGSYGHKRT
jgi:NDP-sugar pyrophosphorylase family protein